MPSKRGRLTNTAWGGRTTPVYTKPAHIRRSSRRR